MTVHSVGFIPAAPLLVPPLAGLDVDRDESLRIAVREVVRGVIGSLVPGATLVIIGSAPETSTYAGTWDFGPLGLRLRGTGPGTLPTPLGVAAWFVDEAGYAGPREYVGVSDRTPSAACATLGHSISSGHEVALLVVGDGSARRDEKAPGYLDDRAAGFDAQAARALAAGDPQAVLAVDADVAGELLASGRAPWQVAAGAARGQSWAAELLVEAAPYGVGYLAAIWLPHLDSNQEPSD